MPSVGWPGLPSSGVTLMMTVIQRTKPGTFLVLLV